MRILVVEDEDGLREGLVDLLTAEGHDVEAAGMTVVLAIDADVPTVHVDADAACQIMANLLDNAERHTRGADRREIRVTVEGRDGEVRVTVADSGPGLSRAAASALFRPFARGGEDPAGLGLGLSIARSLAREMGGDLRAVRSTSGCGASFRFTLHPAPLS